MPNRIRRSVAIAIHGSPQQIGKSRGIERDLKAGAGGQGLEIEERGLSAIRGDFDPR